MHYYLTEHVKKTKDKSGRLFPNIHMWWLKLIFIEVPSAASDVFYREFFPLTWAWAGLSTWNVE